MNVGPERCATELRKLYREQWEATGVSFEQFREYYTFCMEERDRRSAERRQ